MEDILDLSWEDDTSVVVFILIVCYDVIVCISANSLQLLYFDILYCYDFEKYDFVTSFQPIIN